MMCDHHHKKDLHCIPLFSESVKVSDWQIIEGFDFGSALQNIYPLLQLIFEKLPYKDLKSAALVNETWGKIAEEELRKRTSKPSWLSLCSVKKSKSQCEWSKNFTYDTFGFALIFYKSIKLTTTLCVHEENKQMSKYFDSFIPQNVEFWTVHCKVYCVDDTKDHQPIFIGLFLPPIPKINIRRFYCYDKDTEADCLEKIPANEQIKCLLLFKTSCTHDKRLVNALIQKQGFDSFALGGGVIRKRIMRSNTRDAYMTRGIYCIGFTHDENCSTDFDAYSLVVSGTHEFDREILSFRQKISMRKHSVALRMCCADKTDKESETAVFKKHFPNTFLVGFDVNGEIGWDKFSNVSADDELSAKKVKMMPECPESYHQYSTVIVILTWGKVI